MKQKIICMTVALCVLLGGCGWFDGSYVHVTPRQEQGSTGDSGAVSASNYTELMEVLKGMVAAGTESRIINVADYQEELISQEMNEAVRYIRYLNPIGAYAVDSVDYEIGTNSGKPAIAVTVNYRHSRIEIQKIKKMDTMEQAETAIGQALDKCDAGVVLQVADFSETDFSQLVQDYAGEHPESVMETPQVTAAIYGSGSTKVIELVFTYQNSRETLRQMRAQVKPVFDSAVLYVSGEGSDHQKFSQLCAFLMERFHYTLETSITPAYSLLRHGVGDSRTFAIVYAAMCRQAELECMVVTGTRDGEPWTWNIIQDNGQYFHVDLLHSTASEGFREYTDEEMNGYVWDYSAYPACVQNYVQPETTAGDDAAASTDPT